MGRLTRSQKKGKCSSYTNRFLKKRLKFSVYPNQTELIDQIKIVDFVTMCKANAIIMKCKLNDKILYYAAPKHIKLDSKFNAIEKYSVVLKKLKDFPVGSKICNIEKRSNTNVFLCRAAGAYASIFSLDQKTVTILIKNKKIVLNAENYAMAGKISNEGITTLKPMVKAGTSYKIAKAKGKKGFAVSPSKMNVQDSKGGGSYRKSRGLSMCVSRNAPPGRKYGNIAPKRTGVKR